MDSVARQMLEEINRRMSKLQQMARLISEEFNQSINGKEISADRTHTPKRKRRVAVAANGNSRKLAIHEWLKKNGPAKRAEIIKNTGFPEGTVGAYLSTEKDLFENRDGKWRAL